jgi:hypothetical protein
MPGDLTSVLAALICAAFVTAAEPVLGAHLRSPVLIGRARVLVEA